MTDEGQEKIELAAGQADLAATGQHGYEPSCGSVELPVREAVPVTGRRRRRSLGRLDAPKDRLDPRRQFAQVEGLRHVVVRTDFEAYHLVDSIASPGDDHQAATPVLAQLPRDREAV